MIRHLHIENYALIQRLDIDFHPGFSVITGETGAGKSIIIGAIGLILGQRADSRAVKDGCSRCVIEAEFDVAGNDLAAFFDDHDIDDGGDTLIVRRELTSAGKSRSFVNDTPAPLALLKELGDQLIDVHSQHKNLLLGREDFQLNTLDIVAGNAALLAEYQAEHTAYRTLARQLDEAIEAARRNREDEDYLRFQADQLAEAGLSAGEFEELEAEAEMLDHAEAIKTALFRAANCIQSSSDSPDALAPLKQAVSELQGIASVYGGATPLAERLESCYIEMKDVAGELDGMADDMEYNPQRLDAVNERLNLIHTLLKKHNRDSVEELLDLQRELEDKLSLIDNSEERIATLRQQTEAQRAKAAAIAARLSETRLAAAPRLEQDTTARLLSLGMPNARFRCAVESRPDTLTPTGCDQVQYLFNANKSGDLQPVSQVASGGETARVMLALKALTAGAVHLPTIIFDEVDTGVSGSMAEKMARIMREMGAGGRQVISITHLPQIAALGSHHYKVWKADHGDTTQTHIAPLSEADRVEELAHMLSGETLTQAALDNARSLLVHA